MHYNFAADSFQTKKLQAKCNFFTEIGRLAFLRPLWGT